MKKLALILLLLACTASAQQPYMNRPDLVRPLLDKFKTECLERGIEVKERIADLDSILVIEQPLNKKGEPCDGISWKSGPHHWIELKRAKLETPGANIRLFDHEIGHYFGLKDCFQCRYNIMRGQMDDRANFLWRDEILTPIFMDEYYEAIRNPKKWNEAHTHY